MQISIPPGSRYIYSPNALSGIKHFKYSDLAGATNRFSTTLGEGAFGTVYKGCFTSNGGKLEVVVKKIERTTAEFGDFFTELKSISETRHRNLVRLTGWCCSRKTWNLIDFMGWFREQMVQVFLVYELVPNGNLEDHLHRRKEILPWEKRYQIVKGIGSALRYLHHECSKLILHCDIKPRNILLDYDFNAKLADSPVFKSTASHTCTTVLIGTVGYFHRS